MIKNSNNNSNKNLHETEVKEEQGNNVNNLFEEEKAAQGEVSGDINNKDDGLQASVDEDNRDLSGKSETEVELEKKIKEIAALTDTMQRRQADFENYKKRMVKIQEEQKKLAIRDFAFDVININDDLLRAREAACNVDAKQTVQEVCDSFADGFLMISKRIEEMLQKYGIEEIDSLNKDFDPNFNEAVEIDQSEDVECDTITKVHQKGFRLDDYVIRAAKVKVTKPRPASAGNECADKNGSASDISNDT